MSLVAKDNKQDGFAALPGQVPAAEPAAPDRIGHAEAQGPGIPLDIEQLRAEAIELRGEIARLDAERDAVVHLMLRSNSTALGRLGMRWLRFTKQHGWTRWLISRPSYLLGLLATAQWPTWLRVNPLFDEDWYRQRYPDAPAGRRAAYRQYLQLSITEGRDPNPLFDTDWYMDRNPDVRSGRLHPLDHYLHNGWAELRDPSEAFNGFEYMRTHLECVSLAMNPLLHLMRSGGSETISLGDPAAVEPGGRSTVQRTRDYFQRYGARRTVARVVSEIGSTDHSDGPAALAVEPVVPEVSPQLIYARLDSPRDGAPEGSSTLSVSGWACAKAGIRSVDVYIDRTMIGQAVLGLPRPDVAASRPSLAGAADSGFAIRVPIHDVEPGDHVVQVVVHDGADDARILVSSFERIESESMYHQYHMRSLPMATEVDQMQAWAANTSGLPQFDMVILDQPAGGLRATLRSIASQAYPAWRCTVVTSEGGRAREFLDELGIKRSDKHWAIVDDAAAALPKRRRSSRCFGFIHAGEILAPQALFSFAAEASGTDTMLIYSDHDSVERTGKHVLPWFVPEWSPDRSLSHDYVGGVFIARDSARLREVLPGLLISGRTSWRYELLLALSEGDGQVAHVPRVLWSEPVRSADAQQRRATEEAATVEHALSRRGTGAQVSTLMIGENGPIRDIRWPLSRTPKVSIVIPTTGRLDLVTATMASLTEGTNYPDTEVIFVDNSRGKNSDGIEFLSSQGVTVLERDEPFNWAKLNNDAARVARGELLLFLNDDMESSDPGWLEAMVRQVLRDDVGAVGSLLRFPDGSIQHAGVFVVNHGGGAVHLFHRLDPDDGLYLDLEHVTREVTATTGACMMIRRSVFNEVGGFDEDLAVIGNDVDLCLRLTRTGRRVIWTPQSALIHHESLSRSGISHLPDEGRMWDRWRDVLLQGDPHFNENLAQDRVDCALDWGRVLDRPDPITGEDRAAGVNLVGYIRAEMGVGEATRGEAQALTDVDMPFLIIDYANGNPARMDDRSWRHKVTDEPHFGTNILHINADGLPTALSQLPAGLTEGRRNIGYWTWELPEFPVKWHGAFDLVDEVWVPSTFVQESIGKEAPVPVRVVPHAVRVPAGPFQDREHFGMQADAYQFLAMYDTASVQERKNPKGAVEAFKRAFDVDDMSVGLVLKVNNADHKELGALRRLVKEHPNIQLITEVLSRHEMDSLMNVCDAFVSLHRSEGFGLPIAEAMALGKPVIATGWSGNMDFMSEETAACVSYELVTLERSHGPYEKGQTWAEPDLDDAVSWMRRLRDDPGAGERMGRKAASSIDAGNSPYSIGGVISATLNGVGAT